MGKRKGDKLTLDKAINMIEESVLSLDEESECSEDEDFEAIASNLLSSSESVEESNDDGSDEDNEPHTETANLTGGNGTYWRSDTPPDCDNKFSIQCVRTVFIRRDCGRNVQMYKI